MNVRFGGKAELKRVVQRLVGSVYLQTGEDGLDKNCPVLDLDRVKPIE